MPTVSEIRRDNIRALVTGRGALSKLSKAIGHNNPSFLSQQVGPNPTRPVTEKTARKIEEALKLAPGSLDTPGLQPPAASHAAQPAQQVARPDDGTLDTLAAVIRMCGSAYEAEGVPLTPGKFADVVAILMAEKEKPQPEKVRALVRLLK